MFVSVLAKAQSLRLYVCLTNKDAESFLGRAPCSDPSDRTSPHVEGEAGGTIASEERKNEGDEQVHVDEVADEVGQNVWQLPQHRRAASVCDLCLSQDNIKSGFVNGKWLEELTTRLECGELRPLWDEDVSACQAGSK